MFYVESRVISPTGRVHRRQYATMTTYNAAKTKLEQSVLHFRTQKYHVIGIIRHDETILSVKRYGGYRYRRHYVS